MVKISSIFNVFINVLHRDLLSRFLMTWIQNILIYIISLEEHIHQWSKESAAEVNGKSFVCEGWKVQAPCTPSCNPGEYHQERASLQLCAITEWLALHNGQRFLGFTNFSQCFIRNLCALALYYKTLRPNTFHGLNRCFWRRGQSSLPASRGP